MAYGQLCREYSIHSCGGDHYAAAWTAGAWAKTGISYNTSEIPKSQIYLEIIPLFSRGLVRLPDHPRLLRELRLLERTTHKSGRDSVDHPRGQHDDFSNSVCGVLHALASNAGGYDLKVYMLSNDSIPAEQPHVPSPAYASYGVPPTWGPDQPFAERIGATRS
jgi:hypothetical protein